MKLPLLNKLVLVILIGIFQSPTVYADFSKSYDGYGVFNKYCFLCHGAEGKGDGPLASKLSTKVADLTNNVTLSKRTDKELIRIIEGTAPHGQVSGDMPRWALAIPATKIQSLVAYIRYLHRGVHPLPGNPELGKTIYDKYCQQCHAEDGEGDGILTKIFDIEPSNHTDTALMDKMSNKKMEDIIRNGGAGSKSMMPGWKDILSDDEINAVISYIRLLAAN
ncbi:MAG TPA: c-type cytochrome [Gammaproteobacteria bacterium]